MGPGRRQTARCRPQPRCARSSPLFSDLLQRPVATIEGVEYPKRASPVPERTETRVRERTAAPETPREPIAFVYPKRGYCTYRSIPNPWHGATLGSKHLRSTILPTVAKGGNAKHRVVEAGAAPWKIPPVTPPGARWYARRLP